jgi:alpha-ribazole phosphatase
MVRLLCVRHGETTWNAAGRFQGHTDVPLSPRGRQQAAALARVLARDTVQAVYASDLLRTRETAELLATPLGLPVQYSPHWREIAFGVWEGLTQEEIEQRDAQAFSAWRADPMHLAPPGGETLRQVTERISTTLTSLVAAEQERTALLVAHGGTLRVLFCLALGFLPQAYRRFMLAPGSLSELYIDAPHAVLTRLNDTHHFGDTL